MKENIEEKISSSNNVLVSGGLTLIAFWLLNISKTAYPAFKSLLTIYKPIGPLLGLYILSIFLFLSFLVLFKFLRVKNLKAVYWFYIISVILFAFMVFPPIFEPIAHAIGAK